MDPDESQLSAQARSTWSAGNYAAVAEKIAGAGELLVELAGVQPGMDVLDVACGTGNATIPAARLGARVTGLDLVPELLAIARERAADAMVEVDWVEGDAQQLPFEVNSFDRVLSIFGCMFAPDHERTAAELLRVCRPEGALALAGWTPDGAVGDMFATVAGLLGTPPADAGPPPPLWGTEDHVRELLEAHVAELRFERHAVAFHEPTLEGYADFMLESFGPLLQARETLAERADELRPALVEMLGRWNQATDGTMRYDAEYLVALARP
jgi:ubiquinone/menaquinone biosynthesis C-methylase UbiE